MEQAIEERRSAMRYALPIIGAAVPAAIMLIRKIAGPCPGASKEEKLLCRSNVDLQGAMNTALKYMPDTPVEVELDEEHGMPVWEVQIVPKKGGPTREVLIDARTGELLEMRAEFGMEAAGEG